MLCLNLQHSAWVLREDLGTFFRQNVKNIQHALNIFFFKKHFPVMYICVFVVRTTIEIKGVYVYKKGGKKYIYYLLFFCSLKGLRGGGKTKKTIFFMSSLSNVLFKSNYFCFKGQPGSLGRKGWSPLQVLRGTLFKF